MSERVKIELLHKQGKSQVEIAKTVKCLRRAVLYTLQRLKDTRSYVNKKRSGRRRITTEREDRRLIRDSLKNRRKTSSELAADLSEHINKLISASTARKRLLKARLKGCKARKKPWLSEKNKKLRYE